MMVTHKDDDMQRWWEITTVTQNESDTNSRDIQWRHTTTMTYNDGDTQRRRYTMTVTHNDSDKQWRWHTTIMTYLFLVLHLDGVLLDLHHKVLCDGGRPDQLWLQVGQFLLHDSNLGGGKRQLLETIHVAGLQHHDLISLLAK